MHSSETSANDPFEGFLEGLSETFFEHGSGSSSEDHGACLQHPILGNFHLPVEIEDAPKPSGIQNLSRMGWDEDSMYLSLGSSLYAHFLGCRKYLIIKYGWS